MLQMRVQPRQQGLPAIGQRCFKCNRVGPLFHTYAKPETQTTTQTATDMTPEDPATEHEAADQDITADPQAGHPADHLHAAQLITAAPGDTEAPHHTT